MLTARTLAMYTHTEREGEREREVLQNAFSTGGFYLARMDIVITLINFVPCGDTGCLPSE